jgi:hypothetical protein
MRNNCQHVICLRILKHSAATNPRAVARRAVAIVVVVAAVVVVVVVVARRAIAIIVDFVDRRAIAIIVDFVDRRAVATVVVVGRRRHRVASSPVAPSSAYVGYLSSTLFFLPAHLYVCALSVLVTLF